MWIFGSKNAWDEMNLGGNFKIPRIFYFIMKYITPLLLFCILLWWLVQDTVPILLLKNIETDKVSYIRGARILMLLITTGILSMIMRAWNKKQLNNQ
jgi:hypothetical protein